MVKINNVIFFMSVLVNDFNLSQNVDLITLMMFFFFKQIAFSYDFEMVDIRVTSSKVYS